MPKNIVQDVIPRGTRRSIRDIPQSRDSQIFRQINAVKPEENTIPESARENERKEREKNFWNGKEHHSSRNTPRIVLWSIVVVSIIVLVVIIGNIFSEAILNITPKSQNVAINLNLIAKSKVSVGDLSYTLFTLSKDKEEVVPADGEKPVESRSSGRIVIYNNYSTSAQRLVKNTRFETPDGLIYKIADSVTVPGRHAVSGKMVPGSIEVLVYAETVGDEYNIGLTDFTIPGFKSNAERFENFYGRSKTPMTGGKIGREKTVSEEKMLQARARLEGVLTQELLAEATSQVPKTAVFYDTAYRIRFEPVLSGAPVTGNNVALRERAHLTAFFINREELERVVARNSLEDSGDAAVNVPNLSDLKFEMKNGSRYNATSIGPIEFNLKGEASIVWKFDETALKTDLAAKNKNKLLEIISKHPAIVKADVTIRPFWKSDFPKLSKIKILVAPSSN